MTQGFLDGFAKGGGRVLKEFSLPYPSVEFKQPLAEIGLLNPESIFAFFAGSAGAKLIMDWHAAGLKGRIGLCGPGFLTDGNLEAVGEAASGIETTLHYGDGIETPKNKTFRLSYSKAYQRQPDVYAVQGYDTGLLLAAALKAVGGDMGERKLLIAAMEKAEIDSPRGKWKMSKGHNPVQDIYLRKVVGGENRVVRVAIRAFDYPVRGCAMG